MSLFEDLKVFSGNAHTSLAADICSHLGITLGKCEVFKFTNDQSFVRIQENIREKYYVTSPKDSGKHVYLYALLH